MKILKNISLKKYTTIRLGGNAKIIYFPENMDDLKNLKQVLKKEKTIILGNGSNIAFKDNGYLGDLICLKKFKKSLSLIGTKNVYASAGTSCARLAKFVHKNKIPGFEFLHGIPGTVGGALTMNAGAFDQEIWDLVKYVTVIDKNSNIVKLPKSSFKTSYRRVQMNDIKVFIDVYFKINANLKFKNYLLDSYFTKRKSTQPIHQWSSGCIFKNPSSSISASALIDSLIHKDKSLLTKFGGIYISKKHCNYFINDGTGTCLDLEKLISIIKKEIYSRNKINLESEICIY